jgi:hypothetical protein
MALMDRISQCLRHRLFSTALWPNLYTAIVRIAA